MKYNFYLENSEIRNVHFVARLGTFVTLEGKSVLLFANGSLPNNAVVNELIESCNTVVGCDGGGNHCLEYRLTPDYLTGDFDSIESTIIEKFRTQGTQIIEMKNQNMSDFSKTLQWLESSGVKSIDVVGIEGGRLDHQFGVWASLFESDSYATLHFNQFILYRIPNSQKIIHTGLGKIVSLHPISNCEDVEITGCEYELNGEMMSIGTRGIHNVAMSDTVRISKSSGDLLVLIER